MKKLNVLSFMAIALAITSCAQNKKKENVPQEVTVSFNQKFPKAKKVEWAKENDKEWEAEFKMNGVAYAANFLNSGTWIETEYEIKEKEIPKNIKAILDQNFKDYDIEASEISITVEGKSYEFKIEVEEQEFEAVIDPKGVLTKKIVEESQSDED
ncbi:PepSY-like domain-containing protein [Tenacibaculum sp. TC6]|uniref:PepSY-like domain-containing protein n=1 Tax=Tenacibaculum sp. TC6 TaxID=3423223 RepID=UPI003D36A255